MTDTFLPPPMQGVGSVTRITEHLEDISMQLQSLESLTRHNLTAIEGTAMSINCAAQVAPLSDHAARGH